MKNVIVYCEITEEQHVADVSLELLSKGKKLANDINAKLEAVVIGSNLQNIEKEIYPFGVDTIYLFNDKRLFPYSTLPHSSIVIKLFTEKTPEIALFGATSVGRDLAPRVASALRCGLTADCTSLEIGSHQDKDKTYNQLLYQIRPAFGGNIIATIVNPETRPQMATVREGVMKKEIFKEDYKGTVEKLDVNKYLGKDDFQVEILERHIESQKINIKGSQIIVAGGYGVGSKENFKLLKELADVLGGEVGATRAAVDAGYVESDRQIGQTGVTVRPKLYIACGISGSVQHRSGMDESSKIISINTDPEAPINSIADYVIIGEVMDIVPKMIKMYKKHAK